MNFGLFRISRRSIIAAAALLGLVPLGLGAHAALNKRPLHAAPAVEAGQPADARGTPARLALVIGNGHYPDAGAPLPQPINDARALTATLRRDGFDVDVVEDASRDDIDRAIARLKARITPQAVVMLYFGGFGIQAGRESYMIPVDAVIWREADVHRSGVSIDAVLAAIAQQGAEVKLAVIDASRRNPYERRFRGFSHGLAPIEPPDNALALSAATPGKVADDSSAPNSVLMTELLRALALPGGAEAAFTSTRTAVMRATEGAQVPVLSSSLRGEVGFGRAEASAAGPGE
ncbi:MAG TPA: caspase family protein [Rhodopseudomonas sp.]|uniref:caspase family protein n=1 Tax=Rhodopseudomonas sp. TaxID=1078 RepID=UPI002EDAB863